jgi:hypothetical protein
MTNIVSTVITSGSVNVPWLSSNIHIFSSEINNITSASGVTITALQLLSKSFIRSGQSNTVTDELPSASNLINQINIITNTQASSGMNFDAIYINTGSHKVNIRATNISFESHADPGTSVKIHVLITNVSTPNYIFSAY